MVMTLIVSDLQSLAAGGRWVQVKVTLSSPRGNTLLIQMLQSKDFNVENSLQNRLQSAHRKNAPLFQISEFIQGFKIYKIIVKIWKDDTKTDLFWLPVAPNMREIAINAWFWTNFRPFLVKQVGSTQSCLLDSLLRCYQAQFSWLTAGLQQYLPLMRQSQGQIVVHKVIFPPLIWWPFKLISTVIGNRSKISTLRPNRMRNSVISHNNWIILLLFSQRQAY